MDFARRYETIIGWIVGLCPGPDRFAHVFAGLTIWLGAAILLRRPLRSILPLVVVIAAEVANECVDRVANGSWRWHDTLRDAAATWFWPVILAAALNLRPGLRR